MLRSSNWVTLLALVATLEGAGKVDRVVIVKVDGLPADFRERLAPGDSARFPSLEQVFSQNGVVFENFYVRGLSLSASSWSVLDTGRHLEIRGNVEYDRYTLRPYDYLNFFPFYIGYARSRRVDMPGVEMLDDLGIALLSDRFPYRARHQDTQLLQRGIRWSSFADLLKHPFGNRSPKQAFDEWQTGISFSNSFAQQRERDLIAALANPEIRYLDFFAMNYDHMAHLNGDRVSQAREVGDLDALIGKIARAIASSPYPESTLLAMVSDHGMNGQEGLYSQGYNLVDWFTSAAGGGHHAITNRHPMMEFKLRGLDPFVSSVVSPSAAPGYLAGQSDLYPTALLDLDGNERASIGLRNNTLNKLHVLLDQLTKGRLPGGIRAATLKTFFAIRDREKPAWLEDLGRLDGELQWLDGRIATLEKAVAAQPRKWSATQKELGIDKADRRHVAALDRARGERTSYAGYATAVRKLLSLDPADFDPGKFKIESVIPPRSFGPLNTAGDLQHYVTGPASGGFVLGEDGLLDLTRSLQRVDYFSAIQNLRVRNGVQPEVGLQPVDFIAARIDGSEAAPLLPAGDAPEGEVLWLYRADSKQALILTRRREGRLELRMIPIADLRSEPQLHFSVIPWTAGLPLELWEDPKLAVASREDWLDGWHTEREWFEAVHATRYSNGIIGLVEQLLDLEPVDGDLERRLHTRERQLRRTDLLVFAADHWNFNVRGFNPGGNHGSFLRPSTQSVLMLSGGRETGLPRGLKVATPYDGLSFAPTILHLLGRPEHDLPGPVVRELQ